MLYETVKISQQGFELENDTSQPEDPVSKSLLNGVLSGFSDEDSRNNVA